jgi:hydroxyacylglutathione hydrolase
MQIENIVNTDAIKIFLLVTGGDWKENCYLVSHIPSGEQIVIDPGDDAASIIHSVEENGGRLRHILLTHAHHDHVGAVAQLYREFYCSCELHKADVRLLHHAPMYALRFQKRTIEAPLPFLAFDNQPCFTLGDQSITVFHTPGHTLGSVCYLLGNYLFTGDTLFYQRIGRTDLPGGDAVSLTASVNNLLESLAGNPIIFPGHGRAWSLKEARQWWQIAKISPPEYKLPGPILS